MNKKINLINIKVTPFLAMNLIAAVGFGASAHHDEGVPSYVLWQFVNLTILFVILFKALKQPVIAYFQQRKEGYLAQAKKSKEIYEQAEKEYRELEDRYKKLVNGAESSVKQAEIDSESLRVQMVDEAKQEAVKIQKDSELSAKIESQQAIKKIHNTIVNQAVDQAKNVLKKDIGGQDHLKLQTDFNNNIEVVNP